MSSEHHTCPRCQGHGIIPIYRHVNNGICLLCGGCGTRPGKARKPRQPSKPRQGANERLWAEFAAAHPAEAALIDAGKDTDPLLGRAYVEVATFDEYDTNPDAALAIVRRFRQ